MCVYAYVYLLCMRIIQDFTHIHTHTYTHTHTLSRNPQTHSCTIHTHTYIHTQGCEEDPDLDTLDEAPMNVQGLLLLFDSFIGMYVYMYVCMCMYVVCMYVCDR